MDDRSDLEQYFAALSAETGTGPVTEEEAGELLDLARVVAHTAQRKYAPLSTYAAGLSLDPAMSPDERTARIRAVKEAVLRDAPEAGS